MIKSFRHIRKLLLMETGKTSKPAFAAGRYLKYAIGEIVLVVIGILIALSINNWNEYQKERDTEVKVLKEVAENLEVNILRLQTMIERCTTDNQSADIILSMIYNKIPYSDSLNVYFPLALNPPDEGSFLSYVGYESLNNVGFEIIQDNQLKKEIINLFERTNLDLKAKYTRIGKLFPNMISFRQKHFLFSVDSELGGRKFSPIDLDNLINNKQFESQLQELKGLRRWISQSLVQCRVETKRVLELIRNQY